MANLNIGASISNVTSLANLPVTVGTVYATLSAASNISVAAAMYQGQKLELIINPTADITLPMPTTTGWYTTFGDTFKLLKGVKAVLNISCIGANQYLIDSNTTVGGSANGFEYVDLGLPSGLKWATCNVGATDPSYSGMYFQWGAVDQTKFAASYSTGDVGWSTYPFNGGKKEFDSAYWASVSGTVCPNGTLALQYDAAHVHMGGKWRMPTLEEVLELKDNTTQTIVGSVGINQYYKFTGKNGNYIKFYMYGYVGNSNNNNFFGYGTTYISTSTHDYYASYKALQLHLQGIYESSMSNNMSNPIRGVLPI